MDKNYTVQAGDTAGKIAAQYGVPLSSITGYKSGDINKIGVGENLVIKGVPGTPAANTINASNLGQTSTLTPPPTTTPVAPTSLLGLAKATQDQITAYQAPVDQGVKDINEKYTALGGEEKKRSDLYASTGVNTAKQELDDINNSMAAEDKSFRDQVDKIQNNNPTGQLDSGQQIQINKLTKDHSYIMSNLALVANVKLGNYTNAKAIVDKQIDAETEDLKTQLDGLKYFYTQNYDRLSEAKKTLVEQQTAAITRELDDKKELLGKLGEIQLAAAKNGAPASVINAIGRAGDQSAGIAAAGGYLKDPTAAGGFTTSQANNGAAAAGLSLADFNALDPEVKNYFINNGPSANAFSKAVQDIAAGNADLEDVKAQINSSVLTQKVKTYLLGQLDAKFPAGSTSSGGLWQSIKNFFTGGSKAINSTMSTSTPATK